MVPSSCKRIVAAVVACFTAIGCGGADLTTVEGTVRVKGKAYPGCRVFVFDAEGVPHIGQARADGHYRATEVPVGPVRIAVLPPVRQSSIPAADQKFFANQPPRNYWSVATSGLAADLGPSPNTFDIELP